MSCKNLYRWCIRAWFTLSDPPSVSERPPCPLPSSQASRSAEDLLQKVFAPCSLASLQKQNKCTLRLLQTNGTPLRLGNEPKPPRELRRVRNLKKEKHQMGGGTRMRRRLRSKAGAATTIAGADATSSSEDNVDARRDCGAKKRQPCFPLVIQRNRQGKCSEDIQIERNVLTTLVEQGAGSLQLGGTSIGWHVGLALMGNEPTMHAQYPKGEGACP